MMRRFSLSYNGCVFPESVDADGTSYPVYTDYKRMLCIMRLLADPDVLDADKHAIMIRLFFKKEVPPEPQAALQWFLDCGEARESSGEKDFDFEQDAREIYAAFMQIYGIDLADTTMHWWRFMILLEGIFATENALSNKVQIRHVDDSKAKRKNALDLAKRNAELGTKLSRHESTLDAQIRERLKKGQPIHDLIGGVNNG